MENDQRQQSKDAALKLHAEGSWKGRASAVIIGPTAQGDFHVNRSAIG